jgi:hypothetical protein
LAGLFPAVACGFALCWAPTLDLVHGPVQGEGMVQEFEVFETDLPTWHRIETTATFVAVGGASIIFATAGQQSVRWRDAMSKVGGRGVPLKLQALRHSGALLSLDRW